jgi:hypothetical protein
MKRFAFLLVISLPVFFGCAAAPSSIEQPAAEPAVRAPAPAAAETPPPPAKEVFDPGRVSREEYDITMMDVQRLIQDLNGIIRARDYNAWITHLSERYLEEISSEEFLAENTEKLYERDQAVAARTGRSPGSVKKTPLRNARDYFTYVVVPSRANDRVDEIEFISDSLVTAYTVDNRGQRLILYSLENTSGAWKIVN